MSNNIRDNNKKSRPSFSGSPLPADICTSIEDVGEEVTRRAGFQPSFEPLMTSIEPSILSSSRFDQKMRASPMIGTSSNKISLEQRSRKGIWRLLEVPTLPEYHPLERTAVFVPNTQPEEISSRVSAILRDRSIEAFYEDDKAKAKCTTEDGVEFRVRLYRGRGRFNDGIIVEVQRRFGASLSFQNDVSAILDAAQGKVPQAPSTALCLPPLVSDSEDDYTTPSSSSLSTIAKMFKHPGYDTQYLALQTLSSLTDPSRMGRATAGKIAAELLTPDNKVTERLVDLVCDKRAEEDTFKLRVMAFVCLANILLSCDGRVPNLLREQLRPVVIQELFCSEKNPRSAVQAARCIESLIPMDHDTLGIHEALEVALEVGTARHAGLMRQARRCLDMIN